MTHFAGERQRRARPVAATTGLMTPIFQSPSQCPPLRSLLGQGPGHRRHRDHPRRVRIHADAFRSSPPWFSLVVFRSCGPSFGALVTGAMRIAALVYRAPMTRPTQAATHHALVVSFSPPRETGDNAVAFLPGTAASRAAIAAAMLRTSGRARVDVIVPQVPRRPRGNHPSATRASHAAEIHLTSPPSTEPPMAPAVHAVVLSQRCGLKPSGGSSPRAGGEEWRKLVMLTGLDPGVLLTVFDLSCEG
jgi:hypothetical protein